MTEGMIMMIALLAKLLRCSGHIVHYKITIECADKRIFEIMTYLGNN